MITRDKDEQLHCIINACAHRGAMLCRRKTDNRTTFTCPFHGWTFRNSGELLKVKDGRNGAYPEGFNKEGSHDLTKVARFESYRGFLFGSLNPDVKPLEEHLGDATKVIDSIVNQSPDGLEVLRGASTYTYDGNWKVQAENGADGYHVTSVHWNYAATTSRRSSGDSTNTTKAMDAGKWGKQKGGFYSFEHGHLLLWQEWGNPQSVIELLQEVPSEQWHGWLPKLPPSRRTRARVASQLRRASPELLRMAEAVSVLGQDAPLQQVAALAQLSHFLPVVDEGHAAGLLRLSMDRQPSAVHFVEPSATAAVYEQIAPTRRFALHRAAAEVVADEGARLGHLVAASPGPQELLALQLVAYAERQAADGCWSEVASAMLSASRLSLDRRDGDLRLLRGVDALIGAGDITKASSLVGVVESMPPSPLRASVLGYLAVVTGRRSTAAAQLAMAWRTVREDLDPSAGARIALRHTLHALADWDGEGIVAWGERTAELAEAPHHVSVEARAMYGLGLFASRRLDEAERPYIDDLDTTVGNAQEQRLLMGYAWLALRTDDVETARLRFEEAVPTEYRGGSLRISLWAESWLARCQLILGDWDAAAATIAHASVRLESSGMRLMRPLLYWTAAELNAMRGDWDRAEHFLSLTTVPTDGYRSMTVPAALARARYHEARANYESALEALRPLRRADPVTDRREPFWSWQDTLVNSLVMSDQLDEAQEFLDELKAVASPTPFPSETARMAWAEGRLLAARGEVEASQELFDRALDALRSRRRPYLEARVRFAYGQSMRRAGKRRLASRVLRSARELYASLGAQTYVSRCDRELKAAGANALVPAAEQTGSDGLSDLRRQGPDALHVGSEAVQLTAQEQAVAQFVAGGSTNKEVAQALFIAEKTVQFHLTRIYAKFGVRSRSELAAVYAREGMGSTDG